MITGICFILFACVIVIMIARHVSVKRKSVPMNPERHPAVLDSTECRFAIHESGHTLAAWACTIVSDISYVSIDEKNGGIAEYAYRASDTTDELWCRAVISLAGVVAEMVVFERVLATPAKSDLLTARKLAERLVAKNALEPPWKMSKYDRTLPFENMYHTPLSEAERLVLKRCYCMAREILIAYELDYFRLVSMLLAKKRIHSGDITAIFGRRTMIEIAGLFRPTFVLPRR